MNIEMFYYDEHEKMYNEMKMEMEERDKHYLLKNGSGNVKNHHRKQEQLWKGQRENRKRNIRLSIP